MSDSTIPQSEIFSIDKFIRYAMKKIEQLIYCPLCETVHNNNSNCQRND